MAAIADLLERGRKPILLFGVPLIVALAFVRSNLAKVVPFDDAFMFWRYAVHLRDGFGMAWNAGGEPTYGLTSQLWVYFILPFTYTALDPGKALQFASFATGLAGLALGGIGLADSGLRLSIYMLLAILLLILGPFAYHLTTGMDTMLSFATNVLLLIAVDAWRQERPHGALWVGLASFMTVLARPENVIVAFGVPGLAWLLLQHGPRLRDGLLMLGLPAILIAANLLACHLVYGTALPLSFYAKSGAAYEGFLSPENPVRYMAKAMSAAFPSLALCLAFRRGHTRYLLVMTLPVVATFLYLASVRQIMGFEGRYYIPFLPFVLLPAARLVADELRHGARVNASGAWLLVVAPAMALLVLFGRQVRDRADAAWLRWMLPAPVRKPSRSFPRELRSRRWTRSSFSPWCRTG